MNADPQSLTIEWNWSLPLLGRELDAAALASGMAAVLGLSLAAWLMTRRLRKVPGRAQVAAETVVATVAALVERAAGARGRWQTPLVGTLFLFVWASNLIGCLEWHGLPFAAPAGPAGAQAALALIFLAIGAAAAIVRTFGPPPEGGRLRAWLRTVWAAGATAGGLALLGLLVLLFFRLNMPAALRLPLAILLGTAQAALFAALLAAWLGAVERAFEGPQGQEA